MGQTLCSSYSHKIRDVLYYDKEELPNCQSTGALEQAARRGRRLWNVLLWRYSKIRT